MLISLAAQTNAAVERTRHPDAAWSSGRSRLSRSLRVAIGYPGLRIVLLVAPCSQPGLGGFATTAKTPASRTAEKKTPPAGMGGAQQGTNPCCSVSRSRAGAASSTFTDQYGPG